jgi:hypothetical protein
MKPSLIAASLLLLFSTAPLFAHGVFVPLPRNPNPDVLEYKVKVLATNQGLQTRRFQVFRIIPQPFGPPSQEKLADRGVLARTVGIFEMSSKEELSGLLRVTGAPQMVIGALLEIRENGKLLDAPSSSSTPRGSVCGGFLPSAAPSAPRRCSTTCSTRRWPRMSRTPAPGSIARRRLSPPGPRSTGTAVATSST